MIENIKTYEATLKQKQTKQKSLFIHTHLVCYSVTFRILKCKQYTLLQFSNVNISIHSKQK